MLIDVRTYKCKQYPEKHLELYEKFGKTSSKKTWTSIIILTTET